jgi:lipopolysaccharide export system protein LptA
MIYPNAHRATAAGLLMGLLAAGAAAAQIDTHSKAPIDLTAAQAEVDTSKCLTILRGTAEAVQEKSRLRSDTMTVYSHPKTAGVDGAGGNGGCGGADRIEAEGHVFYVTPDETVRGEHAVYNKAGDQIVITGDVVVLHGLDVARGDRLTIQVSTHDAVLDSNASGPGQPGRVRAVFYPDDADNPDKGAKTDAIAKP